MKQWRGPTAMFSGATTLLLATAFFFWNLPVKHYKPSGYSYIGKGLKVGGSHGMSTGWIALIAWILCVVCIWKSSLTIRCLIRYYIRQAKLWGTGHIYIWTSEIEAKALGIANGKYLAKKLPRKAFKYRGIERRKQA
jgi:hypothetical protein